MKTTRLAVSLRRTAEYDPDELCTHIEQWSATHCGPVRVHVERTLPTEASDLLFLNVEFSECASAGDPLVEINQCIRAVTENFIGVEFGGVGIA